MKCGSCGREIPDGAERCPGCGVPVKNDPGLMDAVENEYGGKPAAKGKDNVDDFISQIDIEYDDDTVDGAKHARRSYVWIAAAAAAGVALIIAMILLLRSCGVGQGGVQPTPTGVLSSPPAADAGELSLECSELSLERGDTYKLAASGRLTTVEAGESAALLWTSSDETVASVDGYGVVTATGEGRASVMVVAGGVSAVCEVTVAASEYSEWMSELPAGISSEKYDIESARFYRFREKELTTSTEAGLEGWTIYESNLVAGDFGEWSEWQTASVSPNITREVETKPQYSSRTVVSDEKYGEWSDWSYWSPTRQNISGLTAEEEARTTYRYFYYLCDCGTRSPVPYCTEPTCGKDISEDSLVEAWSELSYAEVPRYEWNGGSLYTGTAKYYRTVIDQSSYFFEDVSDAANVRTEYHYRTRSYTPPAWSDWSDWSEAGLAATPTLEVRTRTLYRYRTMATQSLNYFWRWAAWSEPVKYDEGAGSFESTESVEFENMTLYRYREK